MAMMKRRDRRSGAAIIEFALGSSFMIALFAGVVQFGFTYFAYERLVSAVRAGARYGAMAVYDGKMATVNSVPSSDFVEEVRNVTTYGKPDVSDGAAPLVSGLTTAHVNVNVTFAGNTPSLVTVSINNFEIDALFGKWKAVNNPSVTFTYTGRYAPPT